MQIILDYLGELNVITSIHQERGRGRLDSRRGGSEKEKPCEEGSSGWSDAVTTQEHIINTKSTSFKLMPVVSFPTPHCFSGFLVTFISLLEYLMMIVYVWILRGTEPTGSKNMCICGCMGE